MSEDKPLVLIAEPSPRTIPQIYSDREWTRLTEMSRVLVHDSETPLSDDNLESAIAEATAIIGQLALPEERVKKARNLRALFNVEGNFFPNVDYAACFGQGVRVLNISPVFAIPVAEMALCMALAAGRDMSLIDRAFRDSTEGWGPKSSTSSYSLWAAKVGLIGLGDIGSALREMIRPFRCKVMAYDPWLPASVIREKECEPATLEYLLRESQFIFILAGATSGNQGFIGRKELELVQPNASVLLLSRAAVIDFEAFRHFVAEGRIKGGTDVFPEEPIAADDPIRKVEGMILSSHRAGGPEEFYRDIGRMVNDDLELVLRGLPPKVCKRAEPETITRMRGKPIRD